MKLIILEPSGVWLFFLPVTFHFGTPLGFWDLTEARRGNAKILQGRLGLGVIETSFENVTTNFSMKNFL